MKSIDYILNKIIEFSKVKETFESISNFSNRLKFITNLLEELEIKYFIDVKTLNVATDFSFGEETIKNCICAGQSDKMLIAHYDVLNWDSENANDNSASIINLIALKYLIPELNIAFTDYEEFGCVGAECLLEFIKDNNIKWVLNLELTGLGNKIISSNYCNGELFRRISKLDPITNYDLKRNDGRKLSEMGIDSETICLCPILNEIANFDHFEKCHKNEDNINGVNIIDMKNFIEKILSEII